MEKGQKAGFLRLKSSKITLAEEKKEGEEKKAMGELSVFIMATFEMVFGRKKKRLFDGGDQFVNSARYEIF